MFRRLVIGFAVSLAFISSPVAGDQFFVSSAADIANTLPLVGPGDELVMTDGVWNNQQIQFAANGTSAQPITLRAQNPGQVQLTGNSSINISGDWLVVDGLNFDGGALGSNDHVVEFRGSLGEATNSRFTNSAIVNYNPANIDTRYFWVSMYGQNNRVDHNYFSGQSHSGVTVTVWRNSSDPDFHQIDNNYFADRPLGNGNGFETIRVGTSDESLSDSFTTVENNLFERTDGEIEIISSKSGNNTFRYNTFREAAGTLTLRHGHENTVEGNFFLGAGKNNTGGVRVIGEDHVLINNYFANLDGRADGAISISAGVDGSALNEYFQVKNALIAHNTIVDVNEAAITFDHGLGSSDRTLLAENVTLANNLVRSTADPLFEGIEGSGWTWEGNLAFGNSLGPAAGNPGIMVTDPQLVVGSDGLWRLSAGSPAIDAASLGYALADDMDGQPRVGLFDIGADEFSTASIVRTPLDADDVGPLWLRDNNPNGNDCGVGCVAQQAEDYTVLIDADGNGQTWIQTSSPDALGGATLRAPVGDRVDLPGDPHDALAVYDLVFDDEGTYTAYFRARGFDTSSDSLYLPGDFDVDPDINTRLNSSGVYEWEVGATFEVTASDVGVPLQLRVGKREHLSDFDAFVLHFNGSLTPEQLDALFSPAPDADFNNDGFMDCLDVDALVAEIAAGGNTLDFDLTGDGVIDQEDLTQWLADAGAANLNSQNSYLLGDANLDGTVDGQDFIAWNNHKFQSQAAWCAGDFNADGVVDGLDFVTWNSNKFQSADHAVVPEPTAAVWMLGWVCLCLRGRVTRSAAARLSRP
ncbi:MAG: chondroitinase-B domain-containing protein [Planctomycetota bacterium]